MDLEKRKDTVAREMHKLQEQFDWNGSIHASTYIEGSQQDKPPGRDICVSIDTQSDHKLYQCLQEVAWTRPRSVYLMREHDHRFALKDAHVHLLKGIEKVAIPGHCALTDQSLVWLSHTKVIWLCGCCNIEGANLAECVFAHDTIMSIRWMWGWGGNHPFSKQTRDWLKTQSDLGLLHVW